MIQIAAAALNALHVEPALEDYGAAEKADAGEEALQRPADRRRVDVGQVAREQHVGRAADADQHHAGDADRLMMHPSLEADDGAEHSCRAEAEEDVERLKLHVAHPLGSRRKSPSSGNCLTPPPFLRASTARPAAIASWSTMAQAFAGSPRFRRPPSSYSAPSEPRRARARAACGRGRSSWRAPVASPRRSGRPSGSPA